MEKGRKTGVKPRFIEGLDGFRAIGVLGIIFYHLMPERLAGGYLGVPLFFILSGYLLTDHFRLEYQETKSIRFKNYFIKRVKALYPMLLVMFGSTLTYMWFFQKDLLKVARGAVISTLLMGNNWWQIANGSSYFDRFSHQSPYTHLWFLGVEGQLYLVLPFLFIFLEKYFKKEQHKKIYTLLGLSLLSAALMALFFHPENANRSYYGTDTRAFSLLLGMALAYLWPSQRLKRNLKKNARYTLNAIGLLALMGILGSYFLFTDYSRFIYYGGMWLFSLLAVLFLMMVVHPGSSFKNWFSLPVIKWLGSRSYGIYLFQFPVMIFYESKVAVGKNAVLHGFIEFALILMISELADRFLKILRSTKNKQWKLGTLGISAIFLIFSVVGLAFPPKVSADKNAEELKTLLEKNANLITEETKSSTTEKESQESSTQKTTETKETSETTTSSSQEKPIDPQIQAIATKYGLTLEEVNYARSLSVTGVGDSVLLSTAKEFLEVFPNSNLDGKIGRQVYQTAPILQALNQEGKLRPVVIMGLGTNGTFSDAQFEEVMAQLADKKVFWLNVAAPTVRWQNTVNDKLNALIPQYKNVTLVDWHTTSSGQTSWFYDDQIHPNPDGVIHYLNLLVKTMYAHDK